MGTVSFVMYLVSDWLSYKVMEMLVAIFSRKEDNKNAIQASRKVEKHGRSKK
jgi:hypothetical protein